MNLAREKSEKRGSPRIGHWEFVVRTYRGSRVVRGNIASGGVGFWSAEPYEVGETIAVQLVLPDQEDPIEVAATVKHTQERQHAETPHYIGASFDRVDILDQLPIDRFVEEEYTRESVDLMAPPPGR